MFFINEVKIKNQQMFEEKNKAMQDRKKVVACNQQLEEAITKVCSELPNIQIPVELASIEKLQKLAAIVREQKEEVGKVQF